MNSLGALKTYFKNIATELGCSFEYGDTERVLNRQLSQLTYPLLWLEVPDIEIFRSGGLKKKLSTAFVILHNAPPDDYEAQDDESDLCWNITVRVLQKMQEDADYNRLFEFDMGRTFSQAKEWWSGDNDWGWRTEFSLIMGQCEHPNCCPPPAPEAYLWLEDETGFVELEDGALLLLE